MTAPLPPTTASDAELVAEWRAAMEGVSAGPWRHYRNKLRPNFGGIINEVQCRSKVPVVAWPGFDDSQRKEPKHALNARWIARCSPSGIASLLDRLDKLSAEVAAKDAEIERLNGVFKLVAEQHVVEHGIAKAAEAEAAGLRRALEKTSGALSTAISSRRSHREGDMIVFTGKWARLGSETLASILDQADEALSHRMEAET